MKILDQLSSQLGERSELANRQAAIACIENPELLDTIAEGLSSTDLALAGDCAEVMTMVAEERPDLIRAFFTQLAGGLTHSKTRVRWESSHALSLIIEQAPEQGLALLPMLRELILLDSSVIVRDYSADSVANLAGIDVNLARSAYPVLKEALSAWDSKHAARVIRGLASAAAWLPEKRDEMVHLVHPYQNHARGVIRKAAKEFFKKVAA
jgi:hypothetical protein